MTATEEPKNEETLLAGGFDTIENLEGSLLISTKKTMDLLLKQPKPADLIALYMFYIYTSKWQGTWQIKATTDYVANGLGWCKKKVIRVKKDMLELRLIEDIVKRSKSGKVTGHYIKLRYPCNINTTVEKEQGVEETHTNAYTNNNINTGTNINKCFAESETSEPKIVKVITQDSQQPILPLSLGTTPATRLYSLYLHLFTKKYGQVSRVNEYRNKAILKSLSTKIGEYKVGLSIILFMNWKGASGGDKFIETLLANSCHDIKYLPNNITPILAYAQNKLGIKDTDIINTVNTKLKEYGFK